MSETMFDLMEERSLILYDIENAEGEISEEQENKLMLIAESMVQKADNVGQAIRFIEKEMEYYKELENTYNAKWKSCKNSLERFKANLGRVLQAQKTDKVKGKIITIKDITKPEIVVLDKEKVPYKNKVATITIPYEKYEEDKELYDAVSLKTKIEINPDTLKPDTPGCEVRLKYNTSILGLKKGTKDE